MPWIKSNNNIWLSYIHIKLKKNLSFISIVLLNIKCDTILKSIHVNVNSVTLCHQSERKPRLN